MHAFMPLRRGLRPGWLHRQSSLISSNPFSTQHRAQTRFLAYLHHSSQQLNKFIPTYASPSLTSQIYVHHNNYPTPSRLHDLSDTLPTHILPISSVLTKPRWSNRPNLKRFSSKTLIATEDTCGSATRQSKGFLASTHQAILAETRHGNTITLNVLLAP